MQSFNCGGLNRIKEFNSQRYYQNWLRMLFRADSAQKYTNDRTPQNFYWFVGDEALERFPDSVAQRNRIINDRQELTKYYDSVRVFNFQDISSEKDGVILPDDNALVETWKAETIPDLIEEGYRPIVFVFHYDVYPAKSLRFYVLCEVV